MFSAAPLRVKFLEELEDEIADLREFICSGSCETPESYAAQTAKYTTLTQMRKRLTELFAKEEDEE